MIFLSLALLLDPRPAGAQRFPRDARELKLFVEEQHAGLMERAPDVFLAKMEKAARSDRDFFRTFIDLHYEAMREGPEAERIAATPELWLHGDIHAANVQIERLSGRPAPQLDDPDDSGPGPVGLDLARMLVGAILPGKTEAGRRELFDGAARAYRESLGMDFEGWARAVEDEKAVSEAEPERKRWEKAGPTLSDPAASEALARLAGVELGRWKVLDRTGRAGRSSMGLRRYVLVSEDGRAYEFKELRRPAIERFTGRSGPPDRERAAKAWSLLRQIPGDARALSYAGADWTLRGRPPEEFSLNAAFPDSAARVAGGLAAQLHRLQGVPAAKLVEALEAVSFELAAASADYLSRMRAELVRLLNEGSWMADRHFLYNLRS